MCIKDSIIGWEHGRNKSMIAITPPTLLPMDWWGS